MKRKMAFLFMALTMLITASCAASGSPTPTLDAGFTDVAADAYYTEAVNYCREHGLMNGTSPTTFSPDAVVSRAQFAAILWRQAGSPTAGDAQFPDVPTTAYYAPAVAWASEQGIITGYSDGRFGSDDPVTRAQLATLLWRANGSPAAAPQAAFADRGSIPPYAENAVAWAQSKGIILGKSGNLFDPDGNATRGQAAVILYRYLTGSGQTTPPVTPNDTPSSAPKVLVAYFSATGTTRPLAEYTADILDADLYEVVPETPYTSADLNYGNSSSRANREQGDASARPAISSGIENMAQYDVVFLGYPIWHGGAPKIISTFLESYDFSGKTIVPFCTSHSSGLGSSDTALHSLAPDADWLSGRRFAGGTSRAVMEQWVDSLDLPELTDTATLVRPFDFESRTVTLNSGYEMPINGLGTYSLHDDVCVNSVTAALDSGVRLIDTAQIYGNEAEVGEAIRSSGIPREDIFVITKLYPSQFSNPEAAIEEALDKLGLGYIDMMLLHHPGAGDVTAYKAMEQAVVEGKVRSIGLSNWYVEELEAFLPQVSITPALVQNEIHPYYQENDVIPYIQSLGIVIQGWYPLGGRGHTGELLGDETISAIAQAHGVSSAQVILRWNLQKGVVVIPGSSNPEHIQENTQLYDFALTDGEMAQINALDRNEKHDWY